MSTPSVGSITLRYDDPDDWHVVYSLQGGVWIQTWTCRDAVHPGTRVAMEATTRTQEDVLRDLAHRLGLDHLLRSSDRGDE